MENINLIRKIAWSFHEKTGLDWDDLFQEAAIGYIEAIKTHDPKRGKITTHAWYCISNRLKNYLILEKKYSDPLISIEDTGLKNQPAPTNSFLDQLSLEGQKISELILSRPEEFNCESPKNAKIKAVKKLRDIGIPWSKIWIGVKDLKLAISD